MAHLCIGDVNAVIGLACAIREKIKQKGETKNHFESFYIIWNDFANENKTYLMYFGNDGNQPIIEEIRTNIGLIKRYEWVDYCDLDVDNRETYYFLNTESIFMDVNTIIGILPGYEIKKFSERISNNS